MLKITQIDSLSNFKRNTPRFLAALKESGDPLVLTQNGRPVAVIQDASAYEEMVRRAADVKDYAKRLEREKA